MFLISILDHSVDNNFSSFTLVPYVMSWFRFSHCRKHFQWFLLSAKAINCCVLTGRERNTFECFTMNCNVYNNWRIGNKQPRKENASTNHV